MGILDFLKKGSSQQLEQPMKPTSQTSGLGKPAQSPKSDPQIGDPEGQRKPALSPRDRMSGGVPVTQATYWPAPGSSLKTLFDEQRVRVFVSASFANSAAYPAFAQFWHAAMVGSGATRYYFVPSCQLEAFAPAALRTYDRDDSRERPGVDLAACFADMAAKNLRWNIVWLTTNGQDGANARAAASAAGLSLRWYGVNEANCLMALGTGTAHQAEPNRALQRDRTFRIASQPTTISRSTYVPASVPGIGRTAYCGSDNTAVMLGQPMMTDHISITYATREARFFAKIYTQRALTMDLFERKARRMVGAPIDIPGVCWPKDVLLDERGHFVGLLVPASQGIQLTRSVLSGAAGMKESFPHWDRRDLVKLSQAVLRIIVRLEQEGVYFGCLNPAAIYVQSPEQINLVDCDAWQIEGFQAYSRNQTFTAPERIRGGDMRSLSSRDEESYQAALLAFMILMPGKFPYAKRGSGNEADAIADRSFPFRLNEANPGSKDAERPGGVWEIAWDHIPFALASAFYNTFHPSGHNADPGRRLPPEQLLKLVQEYGQALQNPERAESRALFPKTFRHDGKRVFYTCKICGQEHPARYYMHNIFIGKEKVDVWNRGYRVCLPCSNGQSSMSFTCECCGVTYYYTNRAKILHEIGRADFNFREQRWCRYCKNRTEKCPRCGKQVSVVKLSDFVDRQTGRTLRVCLDCKKELIDAARRQAEEAKRWRDAPARSVSCASCGRMFTITNGEMEYFKSKGFQPPKRCKNCRGKS